jgi:hypothetical protein
LYAGGVPMEMAAPDHDWDDRVQRPAGMR